MVSPHNVKDLVRPRGDPTAPIMANLHAPVTPSIGDSSLDLTNGSIQMLVALMDGEVEQRDLFITETSFLRYPYASGANRNPTENIDGKFLELMRECYEKMVKIVTPKIVITFGELPYKRWNEMAPKREKYNFSADLVLFGNNPVMQVYRGESKRIESLGVHVSHLSSLCYKDQSTQYIKFNLATPLAIRFALVLKRSRVEEADGKVCGWLKPVHEAVARCLPTEKGCLLPTEKGCLFYHSGQERVIDDLFVKPALPVKDHIIQTFRPCSSESKWLMNALEEWKLHRVEELAMDGIHTRWNWGIRH